MPGDHRKLSERLQNLRDDAAYADAVRCRLKGHLAGLVGLEQELWREAAGTLGAQGRRLEKTLDALREIEARFARSPSDQLYAEHAVQRAEAERVLNNLRIQREALGLRNHRELEERYAIPPRLRRTV